MFYRAAKLFNCRKTSNLFLEVTPVNSSLSAAFRVYKWPKQPSPVIHYRLHEALNNHLYYKYYKLSYSAISYNHIPTARNNQVTRCN